MNALMIITCILGLLKTDDIFTGLTNTECSILLFINGMLEGETKSTLPKWGGVSNIINMLKNIFIEVKKCPKALHTLILEEKWSNILL